MATLTVDPNVLERRVRTLLAEQRLLVGALLRLREQLPGSLFTRWARCGKSGCACAKDEPHGPYHVLSTRSGGQGGFGYVATEDLAETRRLVEAYRRFREGMRRLRAVNQDLVRQLGRYQQNVTRRTRRRTQLAMAGKAV